MDFKGKTVVVIGGTSGINRGVAETFARHGADIIVASRSEDKVRDTVASIESLGVKGRGFCVDVRDAEALDRELDRCHKEWGDFDVVVSGAAGNFPAFASSMSTNAFKSVVDIDLLGTFNVMKAVYPRLRRPGASVINISAPQAFLPMQAQSHVCAAKAGVDMITRSLALEWGVEGIRINSIVPGPIEGTEGMKRLAPSASHMEAARDSVPLKRLGQRQDIGHACMFLSSPYADYITGVVLPVDGGWSLSGASALSEGLAKMLKSMV